jgi:hypothetical protein
VAARKTDNLPEYTKGDFTASSFEVK